jgi:5-carboxymethyl-2-hydroxymuconic-semialdehyde dehydrogenase
MAATGGNLQDNQRRATALLERFAAQTLGHFINGEQVEGVSGKTFTNLTPVDNSSLGEVAAGDNRDVNAAATAAREAFPAWRDLSGEERKTLLHKIADLIMVRREEIALVESVDTGQPIRFMSQAALRGAENFRFFADRATGARDGLSLPAEQHINYTIRQPIGPVAVITPWNTPFMLSTWKIAPALAAGCTVVHKPAEWSPLSAMLLAEFCYEAGLPAGVLNLVNGIGEEAGKALTEHPAIKAVAFVGESRTSSLIMAQGAPTLKRVHFELGGKNPVVVFADADLDRALDAVVFMIYSLNGERCTSSSRLLIERSIHDAFVEKLAARVNRLKVGHPLDPVTEIGPLIHPRHLEKVLRYFSIAREEGAVIHAGGKRWEENQQGNFVEPTFFTAANNAMRIAQEEIFGPVLTVIPFDDEQGALHLANDIPYAEKIICIGVNYFNRNEEYQDNSEPPQYPSVFMRTHGSLVGHNQPIVRPPESKQLDYEGEIAVIIGREGRRISEAAAENHIAGLTIMNEGTIRDWLRHGKFNVTQGKNFERTGSLGPWMVTADELTSGYDDLRPTTYVNGEERQNDSTRNLLFPFRYLISYLSTFMRLKPGDVIATGTPNGAGARFNPPRYLQPNDVVEIDVPGIGRLHNTVIDELDNEIVPTLRPEV